MNLTDAADIQQLIWQMTPKQEWYEIYKGDCILTESKEQVEVVWHLGAHHTRDPDNLARLAELLGKIRDSCPRKWTCEVNITDDPHWVGLRFTDNENLEDVEGAHVYKKSIMSPFATRTRLESTAAKLRKQFGAEEVKIAVTILDAEEGGEDQDTEEEEYASGWEYRIILSPMCASMKYSRIIRKHVMKDQEST